MKKLFSFLAILFSFLAIAQTQSLNGVKTFTSTPVFKTGYINLFDNALGENTFLRSHDNEFYYTNAVGNPIFTAGDGFLQSFNTGGGSFSFSGLPLTNLSFTVPPTSGTLALISDIQPSQLEKLNEGNGFGYRIYGRNPLNYGDIGLEAIDLGFSENASAIRGATGNYSTVSGGFNNRASGFLSTVGGGDDNRATAIASTISGGQGNEVSANHATISGGEGNIASNIYASILGGEFNEATGERSTVTGGSYNVASGGGSSILGGFDNIASGSASTVLGSSNSASGAYSSVLGGSGNTASGTLSNATGVSNTSRSYGEYALGVYGTDYTPVSTTSYNGADRLYNIGNGASFGAKSDAFQILKNGTITAPSLDISEIDAASSKALISKEYLNGRITSTITDGVTTSSPSQDAVYDALQLKVNLTGNQEIAGVKDFVGTVKLDTPFFRDISTYDYGYLELDEDNYNFYSSPSTPNDSSAYNVFTAGSGFLNIGKNQADSLHLLAYTISGAKSQSFTNANGIVPVIRTVAPASSTAKGVKGEIYVDGTGLYYCYATNLWHKVTGSTF